MLRRRLKEPFGKAGLTVAIFALVLAVVGGAYAAGALSSKQKREVAAIAKRDAGKPGPAGERGAAGANGTPGGPGKEGPLGKEGEAGTDGADGKSVVTSAAGGECPAGGTKFEVAGSGQSEAVCNGQNGSGGAGALTLPQGATETGTWLTLATETIRGRTAVSFPIPLATPIDDEHVHYVTVAEQEGTHPAECAGSAEEPSAQEGYLCAYEGPRSSGEVETARFFKPGHTETIGLAGAGPAGAELVLESVATEAEFLGTWAVTAE